MKHRSYIGFVIVAAALFSLPQLSHDLRSLKDNVGSRLHRELLHTFFNLPAGGPSAAAPVARPAEALFASCPKGKSAAAPAKPWKGEAGRRPETRPAGKAPEESAMIGDPAQDPISPPARGGSKGTAGATALLPRVKVEAEVAMIIPPDKGIDPRGLAKAIEQRVAALEGAKHVRAEGVRVGYAAGTHFESKGPEWQKATEDIFRQLNGSLPGAYEFHVVRDGAKTKVLKIKCNECPGAAPRTPRAPRQAPAVAPLPAPVAPAEWAGE